MAREVAGCLRVLQRLVAAAEPASVLLQVQVPWLPEPVRPAAALRPRPL